MTEGQTPIPATDENGAQVPPTTTDDHTSQHPADPVAGNSIIPDSEREVTDEETVG